MKTLYYLGAAAVKAINSNLNKMTALYVLNALNVLNVLNALNLLNALNVLNALIVSNALNVYKFKSPLR